MAQGKELPPAGGWVPEKPSRQWVTGRKQAMGPDVNSPTHSGPMMGGVPPRPGLVVGGSNRLAIGCRRMAGDKTQPSRALPEKGERIPPRQLDRLAGPQPWLGEGTVSRRWREASFPGRGRPCGV